MSFFQGLGCLPHGGIGTSSDVCCTGLTAWHYDANTGQPYAGIGCWNAPCASAGQWAGPGGVGNSCCPPLTNVGGKCTLYQSSIPPPASGMGSSTTMYILVSGMALLAVVMMKKKGNGAAH